MSAQHFRLDRLISFRGPQFPPRHRRHPLLRVVMGIFGLALLAVLVFFSVFVGAAMLAAGLLYKLLSGRWPNRRPPAAARQARVVEGEYHVVGKPS